MQLKADIDAEYKAIAEYQKHIYYIKDFHVQAILQRIDEYLGTPTNSSFTR